VRKDKVRGDGEVSQVWDRERMGVTPH